MEQQRTPHERALYLLTMLVPNWRLTTDAVLWAIRIVAGLFLLLSISALLGEQFGRTIWDAAQLLLAASIPVAVALVGNWYAQERARDDALQAYLDYVSKLLIDDMEVSDGEEDGFLSGPPEYTPEQVEMTPTNPQVLPLLKARTLAVLARLDPSRKDNVLVFLYEAGAIYKYARTKPAALSLSGADLRGIDMSDGDWARIDLSGAILSGASLCGAGLSGANLIGTDLTGADLTDADLTDADLTGATVSEGQLALCRSLQGATLPDGWIPP